MYIHSVRKLCLRYFGLKFMFMSCYNALFYNVLVFRTSQWTQHRFCSSVTFGDLFEKLPYHVVFCLCPGVPGAGAVNLNSLEEKTVLIDYMWLKMWSGKLCHSRGACLYPNLCLDYVVLFLAATFLGWSASHSTDVSPIAATWWFFKPLHRQIFPDVSPHFSG